MSDFALDCSVAISWCFEDEADGYSDSVLGALEKRQCHVPALWLLEVANVLIGAERRGRLTQADSANFLDLLKSLPIAVEGEMSFPMVPVILANCRAYTLTAYDSVYLELAMRQGLPLATHDASLRETCRKSGVPLFKP